MAHKSLIKEITKALEAGNICFVHKGTRHIETVIDLEDGMEDTEERQIILQKLEENTRDYMKIPRMSSFEEMHVREDFMNEPVASSIKKELATALKRKNPVRNFMTVINSHEVMPYYWERFKTDWYEQWVEGYLLDVYYY